MKSIYTIKEKVWLYPGESASWHFVSLSKKDSKEIKKTHGKVHRGFGSIRVIVTVGKTTWKTSVFPSKEGMYVLPIKASVRQKEGILNRDTIALKMVF
ncbi:MAG: DUF1905 domain-containing protein [Candidatus Pacebacteria bacterium]|nr:DUF1905 domain-containing protein [Candidatus Paceibacterota bacterium]